MRQDLSTFDVYLAAWIYLNTEILPELKFYQGMVYFSFAETDSLIKALRDYRSGKKIEACKYVVTIKSLETQIFQLKEVKENEQEKKNARNE